MIDRILLYSLFVVFLAAFVEMIYLFIKIMTQKATFQRLSEAHVNWGTDDYKWYKTTCSCCGKEFEVKISEKRYKENPLLTAGCTCFECIPENSRARNGMDEDCYEHKE